MSHKIIELRLQRTQALRDQVVERLVVAADDIFALFEQTFAQYQREYQQELISKLLQDHKYHLQQRDPREDLRMEDVQSIVVQAEVEPNLSCVKYEEEDLPLDLQLQPLDAQSEENIDRAIFSDCGQEAIGVKLEREESESDKSDSDEEFKPCSSSETDDSEDWEPTPKRVAKTRKRKNGLGSSKNQKDSEHTPNQPFIALKDKAFSCPVCHKTFAERWYLKLHKRIHTGEKPFRCEPCGLGFTFKQNYGKHMSAHHHTERPFEYKVCEQRFTDKSQLKTHQDTHIVKTPFKCLNCNKTFDLIKNLMSHKMSETCF